MSERTFDDFDAYAEDYRSMHNRNIKLSGADSYYFAEMKVRLLASSETDIAAHVLDIGCGDGATELFMQQYFPSWNIAAIDVSEKSIMVARCRNLQNAVFSVYDGRTVPLPDNSVDIVFMAGVLHHVAFDLHGQLIKEVHRVLKKGGRFYLFEHNPNNPLTRHLVNTCAFDKDARLLPHGYASTLLTKNGLKIAGKKFIIFFPRKGLLSKFVFMEKYLSWLPVGGQYFVTALKP